jgi:hypothetical protein
MNRNKVFTGKHALFKTLVEDHCISRSHYLFCSGKYDFYDYEPTLTNSVLFQAAQEYLMGQRNLLGIMQTVIGLSQIGTVKIATKRYLAVNSRYDLPEKGWSVLTVWEATASKIKETASARGLTVDELVNRLPYPSTGEGWSICKSCGFKVKAKNLHEHNSRVHPNELAVKT